MALLAVDLDYRLAPVLDSAAHLVTPFFELLEPLGLVDKYCWAFAESGVHFEVNHDGMPIFSSHTLVFVTS